MVRRKHVLWLICDYFLYLPMIRGKRLSGVPYYSQEKVWNHLIFDMFFVLKTEFKKRSTYNMGEVVQFLQFEAITMVSFTGRRRTSTSNLNFELELRT